MPNGNSGFRRVEAVIFDAMHTIFQPLYDGDELNAQVYRDIAGVRVDAEALAKYIHTVRTLMPRPRSGSLDEYWSAVNAHALKQFWPRKYQRRALACRTGRRIHQRILSDPTLYQVTEAMRHDVLEWLKAQDGVRVVLASNQNRAALDEHLRRSNLEGFFGDDIFTADAVGCSKLDPEFWETLREKIGVEHFASLAHIGNSVESDTDLARNHGTPTALLDFSQKIGELKISGVTVVHSETGLRIWLEFLLGRHENGSEAVAVAASALVDAQADGKRRS